MKSGVCLFKVLNGFDLRNILVKRTLKNNWRLESMIFKTLSKKGVKEVIEILGEGNKLCFSEIQKKLPDKYGKNLDKILKTLLSEGLVEKSVILDENKRVMIYYHLTGRGKVALTLYKIEERLDKIDNVSNVDLKWELVYNTNPKKSIASCL